MTKLRVDQESRRSGGQGRGGEALEAKEEVCASPAAARSSTFAAMFRANLFGWFGRLRRHRYADAFSGVRTALFTPHPRGQVIVIIGGRRNRRDSRNRPLRLADWRMLRQRAACGRLGYSKYLNSFHFHSRLSLYCCNHNGRRRLRNANLLNGRRRESHRHASLVKGPRNCEHRRNLQHHEQDNAHGNTPKMAAVLSNRAFSIWSGARREILLSYHQVALPAMSISGY
jgi:hypothetical protein